MQSSREVYFYRQAKYANDTTATAEYHGTGSLLLYGYLANENDDDTFKFRGEGVAASVKVSGAQDVEIRIYDENRNLLSGMPIDLGWADEGEEWTGVIPYGQYYYVKISPYGGGVGFDSSVADLPYILTFTPDIN